MRLEIVAVLRQYAGMTGAFLTLLTASLAATVPPPPPPVSTEVRAGSPAQAILTWRPGEVRCDGAMVTPAFLEPPLPTLGWGGSPDTTSLTFAFDIAADGRTVGIRQSGPGARTRGAEDIAPSLAAARFAPGGRRAGCTITYVARQASLAEAPLEDLFAYSNNPLSGPLPRAGWQRIHGEGNCHAEPTPGLRTRAYPNFRTLPATPGARAWSTVGYDIAESGRTANVRTLAGTGNSAFDAASRQAVEDTRYFAGGRDGCRYSYWLNPAPLPAPPAPAAESFRPTGATCPERRDWVVQPTLRYPEPYRRRAIEGWAIVTYDVAPWGELGNIQVAASQPTEEFGTQAIAVMRGARLAATQGFVGCVSMVKFELGDQEPDAT